MIDFREWIRLGVAGGSVALAALVWCRPDSGAADGERGSGIRSQGKTLGEAVVLGGGGRLASGRGRESTWPAAEAVGSVERARPPAPLPKSVGGQGASAAAIAPMTEEAIWSHYEPSREELAYRASVIERQAEAELRNLLSVVDLEDERQDRVFAALVRSSEWYHPALQPQGAGGAPISRDRESVAAGDSGPAARSSAAAAVDSLAEGRSPRPNESSGGASDLVLAELTPQEADVYQRYTSERVAFWVGVVEDVERQLSTAP